MVIEEKDKDSRIVLLKLSLYCISLWILMFMLIVLKIDVSMIDEKNGLNTLKEFLCANIFSWVCICIILVGLMGYVYFKDYLKNAKRLPVEIEECESVNYENLSFLATYVIPLVCFPMETDREIFVLFAVITIIGCIFVKTNLYYTNPSLVLMGFNVYSVKCKNGGAFKNGIVIVKGKLKVKDIIKYMSLSDNVYFARRIK
ncbi:hypothetical protein DXC13_09810 [Agathobacter rectalis]|jgi:hypothetical protein|uniref:Uncharacterized protein n=1 Tax=Agathobacter rectalis TaxID=39491 RepID=A0A3E4X0V5_9FIRM|nr:anti-phage protein KwaA [Agathobacter rectalis]RGM47927.1 hypothetical protein DXC13_09810 [Agathobacter rectalis]